MLDKAIEQRREKVQALVLKGYNQKQIADKLNVHWQTVHKDIKFLNKRYSKYAAKHPDYLQKKLDKVFKFIDELSNLKTHYWELKQKAAEEIDVIKKVKKKQVILKIPRGSLEDERKILDSILKLIDEEARILQLTGSSEKYLQQNFIHIDQVNAKITPLVQYFINIIHKYVPQNDQRRALDELKQYDEKSKK